MNTLRRHLVLIALPLLIAAVGCGKTVGETIDDATITTRVKTSLLNDPAVAGLKIDVDTFKGVVTLSGAVKSRQEEQTAIRIARGTPGVKDVKSTLQVTANDQSPATSASPVAQREQS